MGVVDPVNQARGHGLQLKLVPVKEEVISTDGVPTTSQQLPNKGIIEDGQNTISIETFASQHA